MKYLEATNDRAIIMRPLDKESLHIKAYTDASFATNYDISYQLGYIAVISDKFDYANILNYVSQKNKKVAISVLGQKRMLLLMISIFHTLPKGTLKTYYRNI